MRIATYLNDRKEVVGFEESGSIYLYDQIPGGWEGREIASLSIEAASSLAEIRGDLQEAAKLLPDCSVFLVGRSKGLLTVYLEDLGFHTWKSEGALAEQLDSVALHEERRRREEGPAGPASSCGCSCSRSKNFPPADGPDARQGGAGLVALPDPEPVGDAALQHYKIDLASILRDFPTLNSHRILEPFLAAGNFRVLDIICDHLPKWLVEHLDILGFGHHISQPVKGEECMTLVVVNEGCRKL